MVEFGGAVGDGSTNDAAAFQRTIDAACNAYGTVVIPAPAANYRIANTLFVTPKAGESQAFVNFRGEGAHFAQIVYTGTGPCFHTTGWKRSTVSNVRVRLPDSANGVDVWSIDGDATSSTTGNLTFVNCDVTGNTPAGCAGFVLGGRSTGGVDVSFIDFINCHVGWAFYSSNLGFANLGSNSLAHQWFGCDTVGCAAGWTNRRGTKSGNASMHLFGSSGGYNVVDLQATASEGVFMVHGGRFEHGRRFLDTGTSNGRQSKTISVESVLLGAYAPSDGIVFNVGNAGHLNLDHITAYPASSAVFGSSFIRLATSSLGYGSLQVRGCHWPAADPFYTVASGNWRVKVEGCTKMVSGTDFQTAGFFTERVC